MSAIKTHPFAAVVLAAGAGSRFGTPKVNATLPDGRRFIDVVVERCATAGADPIIAVVPPDVVVPAPARGVVNAHATGEQVKSLRLGIAQLANTAVRGVLVWPVDHPFAHELSAMAVVDAARRTGAPIVVPVHGGRRGHPVWFARDTWRELTTVADGGARAVVQSDRARVHEVSVPDAGICRDVDTPADLD
jgi:molybdenum cofactor cytidylyltransferase